MNTYIKKPVQVEALQWDGTIESGEELLMWVPDNAAELEIEGDSVRLFIKTLEGRMRANPGDYIIKGVRGEYPCRQDIFEETYVPAGSYELMPLDTLLCLAGETAEESGWHEGIPDPVLKPQEHAMWLTTKVMLVVSELAEAVEEVRDGRRPDEVYEGVKGKPEGFPVELADAVIRLFDLWWTLGQKWCDMPDMAELIDLKVRYNRSRGARHGGKVV